MVLIDALILWPIYDVRIISKVFEIIFIATKNNISGYIITGLDCYYTSYVNMWLSEKNKW
mgnify:CR=1 FL=1